MSDSINTERVHPEHVAGPDALVLRTTFEPWGPHAIGLTFDQAEALADHLRRAVKSFRQSDARSIDSGGLCLECGVSCINPEHDAPRSGDPS